MDGEGQGQGQGENEKNPLRQIPCSQILSYFLSGTHAKEMIIAHVSPSQDPKLLS